MTEVICMTTRIWVQATNLIHFQRKNMGSPDFYVNSSDFLIWHFLNTCIDILILC